MSVKKIYLDPAKCLSKEETERKYLGEFLTEDCFDLILTEDADVYKPDATLDGEPQLLVSFRKNVFPKEITRPAYEGLNESAVESNNRGISAGPVDVSKLSGSKADAGKIVVTGKTRFKVVKEDGTVSKTTYANPVNSGIVGFFDSYPRIPYCRTTSYTEKNLEKFDGAIPFLQGISEQFRLLIPERWANQKAWVDRTTSEFCIRGTVFSTVTVNKNFRTAGHYDAGDLQSGFGNLTVLEKGRYEGAFTGFPRYRVGVDVREGDFLGMDVHELHGNTPLKLIDEDAERVSIVCYYRENMFKCGTKEAEDKKKNEFWSKTKNFQTVRETVNLEEMQCVPWAFDKQ